MTGRSIAVRWAGTEIHLRADPALWWPEGDVVMVADVHVGKEHVLRSAGMPVPTGTTDDDLLRLRRLVSDTGAAHLVVLGDFWHGIASRAPDVLEALELWRRRLSAPRVTLVRGNHDRAAGDPPEELDIAVVDGPWKLGPFTLRHEPEVSPPASAATDRLPGGSRERRRRTFRRRAPSATVAGHIHPVVRLEGHGGDRLRAPCFWLSDTRLVLPAFGGLTGGAPIRPVRGERIFAVGEGAVMEVPLKGRSG